uniref:Xylulose kinase n=1 Tax=Wollemia nobilis TaxID=56998 RepID=A0A0C9RZ78_9CONI
MTAQHCAPFPIQYTSDSIRISNPHPSISLQKCVWEFKPTTLKLFSNTSSRSYTTLKARRAGQSPRIEIMAAYSIPEDALFLGLDSSTQSLKATVLDRNLRIVCSETVHFDSELPHYETKDGVYRGPSGNGRVVSPPLMWVEALDLMLNKLKKADLKFDKVRAISGSGQQHGSVYWKKGTLDSILKQLNPNDPLSVQLQDAFSTNESPIWMDSSTTTQCREIEKAIGGAAELSLLTGSRAYERYTGPQIRKLYETQKHVYDNTERISLVSSFMASLLIGGYASIDETDGAGMNLMDLRQRIWLKAALEATAPNLEEKLGPLAPPHAVAGNLSTYFVDRFMFDKNCLVIQWSGDNPNSLAGLALNRPGDLAISLGTSDVVFGITTEPHPGLEGHVLPNPVDPNCYMVMLVYKNGSLTREDVRNRCAKGSWDIFNEFLEQTPPLNGGKMGFHYKEPEILPPLPVGIHRYELSNFEKYVEGQVTANKVPEFDAPSEVRAIMEGQFLSMRAHAERIGMPSPPERLIATGGASANTRFLSLIASIFGCSVDTVQRPDSASLGAALRAAHGWACHKEAVFIPISSLYEDKSEQTALTCKLSAPAGDKDVYLKYSSILPERMRIEQELVEQIGIK